MHLADCCSNLTWIDQELNKNWDAVERNCMWEKCVLKCAAPTMLKFRSAPELLGCLAGRHKNIVDVLAAQNVMDSGGTETNEEWVWPGLTRGKK